jgi:hypothetical protein
MDRCVEQALNSFKQFKSFKPPPLSSPALRGRKEVGENVSP